jgi:hypothetical protein
MKPYVLIILLALLPALVRFDIPATCEAKDRLPAPSATYPEEKPREIAAPLDNPAPGRIIIQPTGLCEPREKIPSRYASWFM